MSKIWMPGGGGGGAGSDDCTLVRANVPKGLTAITRDSDDEAVEGTLNAEGTAADSQVLDGQTYVKFNPTTKLFERRTGSMPNKGAWTGSVAMNGSVTIAAGYYNGGGKVNGPVITNRGGYGGFGNSNGNDAANSRMWVRIPGGYYNENANVYLSWANIRSLAGLTADKLKKNVSIMGLIGSFEGYVSSPLYLFNNGTWSGLQTTGWQGDGADVSGGRKFRVSWASASGSSYSTDQCCLRQLFNLTDYKYIKVTTTEAAQDYYVAPAVIAISPTYNNGTAIVYSNTGNINTSAYTKGVVGPDAFGTAILDVSNITGSYYIYVGMRYHLSGYNGNYGIKISQLYLTNN